MPTASFGNGSRTGGKGTGSDMVYGRCVVGLEQLCKVSVVTSGGISGRLEIARMLLKDGLPLYSIDTSTFQVGE